jgi:hypothetical protein
VVTTNYRGIKVSLIVISLFSIINLRFVLRDYAWADDWSFFEEYQDNSLVNRSEHIAGFRPILQIIFNLTWPRLDSIDQLWILRTMAILGLLILASTLLLILLKSGYGSFLSLVFVVSILFLPTFQIYQKWATAFAFSWCALISLLAYIANTRSRYLVSFSLLLISFLIYQPAATFGLLGVLIELISRKTLSRKSQRFMLQTIVALIFATVVSRLILVMLSIEPKARSSIIDTPMELLEKMLWIVTRPIPLMFRPFLFDSPTISELALTMPLWASFFFVMWQQITEKPHFVRFTLSLVLVILLMLLPLLPIAENQIEFRVLPSTSAAGLFMILVSLNQLLKVQVSNLSRKVVLVGIPLLFFAGYAEKTSEEIFITPYVASKAFIEAGTDSLKGDTLFYHISYSSWPMRDFVGSPSAIYDLQMPWVVEPMLKSFTKNKFGTFVRLDQTENVGVEFLDLDKLKKVRLNSN